MTMPASSGPGPGVGLSPARGQEADEFLEGKNDAKGEAKAESRAKKQEGDEKD